MLSLFLILKQNYKSIVIWMLQALYTLLIVCNRHSLFYIFIIQSLLSHHIIIVKVIAELIFVILGEWETGGLPLWFLTLQYIFLKKRHLVLGAAQEGLAKVTSRSNFGFLPSWRAGALSWRLSVLAACSPETYVTNIRTSWGHKNALAVLVLLTCTAVEAVTSSSLLPACRAIEFLSVLAGSFDILAKIGGRGGCSL